MKILYDHQIFVKQIYGGISRYFFELMNYYQKENSLDFDLSLVYSNNAYIKNASFRRHYSYEWNRAIRRGLNPIFSIINLQHSKSCVSKGEYDILHPTYYDLYYLKKRRNRPYVLTVYDLIQEIFPELFRRDRTREKKKIAIQNADAIIAISESTKTDILNQYDIDPGVIRVIHLASSLASVEPDKSLALPEKYIVFVGNREIYKNFGFFIRAVTPLLLHTRDMYVVCAGGPKFDRSEIDLLRELGISRQVIHYPITDGILFNVYSNAELFVFPSLYEGFGIPVLEAFGAGCPVAASDTSSLPEVGGDAARYFNPRDASSILNTVETIINDPSLQCSMREKGYQRHREFSWEKTAEETRKVYESLI